MQGLTALVVTRLVLPVLVVGSVLLVLKYAALGLIGVFVICGLCGAATDYVVRRRASALSEDFVPVHLITLDDGTPQDLLNKEGSKRPMPTRLLGFKYAAAWSTQPDAVVRVAPQFYRAVVFDILGIVVGVAVFLAIIVELAHLAG